MPGMQFLGTMPREEGDISRTMRAAQTGVEAFLNVRGKLDERALEREKLGLEERRVGAEEERVGLAGRQVGVAEAGVGVQRQELEVRRRRLEQEKKQFQQTLQQTKEEFDVERRDEMEKAATKARERAEDISRELAAGAGEIALEELKLSTATKSSELTALMGAYNKAIGAGDTVAANQIADAVKQRHNIDLILPSELRGKDTIQEQAIEALSEGRPLPGTTMEQTQVLAKVKGLPTEYKLTATDIKEMEKGVPLWQKFIPGTVLQPEQRRAAGLRERYMKQWETPSAAPAGARTGDPLGVR